MSIVFNFVAQGKQKTYPGKSTIMKALDNHEDVELTFFCEDNKLVIVNHLGEISGCIPANNPATKDEYLQLRTYLAISSSIKVRAIPHNVFNYGVQVEITI